MLGNSDPKAIGRRIREARLAAGFKKAKPFAEALGLHTTAISRWEKGHVAPGTVALGSIATVCGVTVDWLATGRGDEPKAAKAEKGAA